MIVHRFVCGPFEENTYIAHENGEAVLIDPGCFNPAERKRITDYISAHKLTMKRLLLTHGHIDHVLDLKFFAAHLGLAYEMHAEDAPLIEQAERTARAYGMRMEAPEPPTHFLDETNTVAFGKANWQIFHTPGHSPGSICFYDATNGFVIGGDVLFAGSVGRTDLWQGSMDTLLHSIETKLMALPDETVVYSGHGRETTIGRERLYNPFLK